MKAEGRVVSCHNTRADQRSLSVAITIPQLYIGDTQEEQVK